MKDNTTNQEGAKKSFSNQNYEYVDGNNHEEDNYYNDYINRYEDIYHEENDDTYHESNHGMYQVNQDIYFDSDYKNKVNRDFIRKPINEHAINNDFTHEINIEKNTYEETSDSAINTEKDEKIRVSYSDKKIDKNQNKSLGRELLEMILYFVFVIVFALIVHQFVGQQIEVNGSSMENTLHNKDHLILEKISYETGDPERFDIIVFQPYVDQKKTYYIKRVIGLPGETIQIIDSQIYINNEKLEEDYGKEEIKDAGIAAEPITLGEDEYFVLGDNRNNSTDSRDSRVGIIKRSQILGRAWVRIWPLKDFGVLEHQ